MMWDIKNALQLRSLIKAVSDPRLRALAERTLDRFENRVQPRLNSLRAQIIHDDLNPANILVEQGNSLKPAGIIDFGDLVHTPLINDLAVAAAYQLNPGDDPLAGALPLVSGYHAVTPLEPDEMDLLPDLVMARLTASILIANWRVSKHPQNRDYILIDSKSSRARLAAMDATPRIKLQRQLRQACCAGKLSQPVAVAKSPKPARLLARRDSALGPAYRLFYKDPLHIVRGDGVWLYEADGRAYLDVYNNVPHVGHCHPHVVDSIARQATILNTHTRYLHESVIAYTERLLTHFPDALSVVNYTCSGSESNELALRIARTHSGGEGIIVTRHAYHGNTHATGSISTEDWPLDALPPHVVTVPAPDPCRGPYRNESSELAAQYAAHVSEAIETLHERGLQPAALIVDTIFSSEGILDVPPGYLALAAGLIREAGGVFIADEVQPGFGRTGMHFWGFEVRGVTPDIVTLGKPMGNGHPVSAVVMRPELAAEFAGTAHYFNTFGGNPVSAAAAMAVLDVIEQEALQTNALQTGGYLRLGLEALTLRHELIGEIRGSGLYLGVDLQTDRDKRTPATTEAAWIHNDLRDNGVLIGTTGPFANVLKLRPPMVFERKHADLLLTALEDSLSRV
jgi:4-aminobutyrate aminotransferase-like enzyme